MRMTLIFLLGCFVIGCSTLPTEQQYREELQAKLRTVVYEDGINQQESRIIADAYLAEHMAASLGHTGPYDAGDAWAFKITGDIAPVELTTVPPVLVDKRTGAVVWEAEPPLKK
jgi:hypothetical protein